MNSHQTHDHPEIMEETLVDVENSSDDQSVDNDANLSSADNKRKHKKSFSNLVESENIAGEESATKKKRTCPNNTNKEKEEEEEEDEDEPSPEGTGTAKKMKRTFPNNTNKEKEAEEDKPSPECSEQPSVSENMRVNIFQRMFPDNVSLVAQTDPLIVSSGCKLFNNLREKRQKKYRYNKYVITRMRDMAKLLIEMQAKDNNIKTLEECLEPYKFHSLMDCVQKMSEFDEKTGFVNNPSVALRIMPILETCIHTVRARFVEDGSTSTPETSSKSEQINDFLVLFEFEWRNKIGYLAEKSRKEKALERDSLPDCEDVITVFNSISSSYNVLVDELRKDPNPSNYSHLAKHIIAHIVILNRQSADDITRAHLNHYKNESDDSIPEAQRHNAENLDLFHVPGKYTQMVPCLLTKEMKKALDVLVNSRECLDIDSPYLFAKPNVNKGEDDWYDGATVIDEIKSSLGCQLKKPSNFTATGLRSHKASMSQLLEVEYCLSEDDEKGPFRLLGSSDDEDEMQQSKITRARWSDEEKEVLYKYFGKQLLNFEQPTRRDIKNLVAIHPALSNRSLNQVCTYINNIVNRKTLLPPAVVRRLEDLHS